MIIDLKLDIKQNSRFQHNTVETSATEFQQEMVQISLEIKDCCDGKH